MIKKTLLVGGIIIFVAVVGLMVNNQVRTSGDLDDLETRGSEVKTDHGSFQVHDFGEGPALVFLSGLGTTSPYHDFKPLWDELQKTHRIVILERPGYGYNQTSSKDKAIGTMVKGYREALKTLEIDESFSLVAHSMGGLEALYWSEQHPDEVKRLVGLDIAIPPVVAKEGNPSIVERNVQYMVGRLGVARFMEEEDLDETLPLITHACFSGEEKEEIETLFHANMFNRDTVRESKTIETNAKKISREDVPSDLEVSLFLSEENMEAYGISESIYEGYFEGQDVYEAHSLDTYHYVHHEADDTILSALQDTFELSD
ncbi:MAG: alpha/beta fold hydrolase [Candidatus Izemoplasmataceae bacterium]